MRSILHQAQPQNTISEEIIPQNIQNLQNFISDVISSCNDLQSNSFRVAIASFQKFVKAKYQKSLLENEESNFLNDLFCSVSMSKLSNPLHYLVFANALIGADIGNKISKANHIARDIPSLPPSSTPVVYSLLEAILIWLSNILGSTMHIILQPLREKIWNLSSLNKDDPKAITTSLYLLKILLCCFPSSLNANFENIQMLLFSTIQSSHRAIRRLSVRVLECAFKLTKTPHSAHIWPLFDKLSELISNSPSTLKLDVVTSLFKKCERNEKFASAFKFYRFSSDKLNKSDSLLQALPLMYLCSPSIFTDDDRKKIINAYFKAIKRDQVNRNTLCLSAGQTMFMFGQSLHSTFSSDTNKLFQYLYKLSDKSDEVIFAILSLMSDETDEFYEILGKTFSSVSSKIILKGLAKLIQKWPLKAPMIRKKVIGALTTSILNEKSDEVISYAFSSLKMFNITMKDMTNDILMHYSIFLSHQSLKVRKTCSFFLLQMQNMFPSIQLRLLSFVGTEVHEELRVTIFERINGQNSELIMPLMSLFHDSKASIRRLALIKLCEIQDATPFVANYVNEVVSRLKQNVLFTKDDLHSLFTISEKLPNLVQPYSDFLIQKILERPQQTSRVALRLLTLLIPNSNKVSTESLVPLLSSSLNKHSTPHKLLAALNLLIVSLHFTSLRETIRTTHLSLLLKLIELSWTVLRSSKLKLNLFNALIKIGPVSPEKVKQKSYHDSNMMNFVAFLDLTKNPKVSQLLNLSVITSLHTVMEILSDESLVNFQPLAFEALLSILKYFPPTDETIEEEVLQKVIHICRNSMTSMMHNISTLLYIFGDKIGPLMPYLMDSIFENWGKISTTLILRTINMVSLSVPKFFEPYLSKIAVLITTSLSLQPSSVVIEIMATILTFGNLLNTVDYIIIPSFINWIETNAKNTEIANTFLYQFRTILINCEVTKFSTELIKTCIIIVKQNPSLKMNATKILLVLLYQMRDTFFIFLPDLLQLFELKNDEDFNKMVNSINSNSAFDKKINDYYGTPIYEKSVKKFSTIGEIENSKLSFKMPNGDWDAYEWCHWCDEFIPIFLMNSSSRAIVSCNSLCERDYNIRALLFPITFALSAVNDDELQNSVMKIVMESKTVPASVLCHFVRICELLEVSGQQIPISWDVLSEKAIKTGMLPLALRFTEHAFEISPDRAAERLVFLNQSLGLNDAADAVLYYSHEFNETLNKKLGKWEESLKFYTAKLAEDENNKEYKNGKLEALEKLGRFLDLKKEVKGEFSIYSASAALRTFSFDDFKMIMKNLKENKVNDTTNGYNSFVNVQRYRNSEIISNGNKFIPDSYYNDIYSNGEAETDSVIQSLFEVENGSLINTGLKIDSDPADSDQIDFQNFEYEDNNNEIDSDTEIFTFNGVKVNFDFLLYDSIYSILNGNFKSASSNLQKLRERMPDVIFPAVSEDYSRSFSNFCYSCLIEELDDIIQINDLKIQCQSAVKNERENAFVEMAKIENEWKVKFDEVYDHPFFMYDMLMIRSLVLNEEQMIPYFVKFLLANSVNGFTQLSQIVLGKLSPATRESPDVKFAEILMMRHSTGTQNLREMPLVNGIENLTEKSVKEAATVELSKLNNRRDLLASWLFEDGKYADSIHAMEGIEKDWLLWSKANFLLFKENKNVDFLKICFNGVLNGLQKSDEKSGNSRKLDFSLKILSLLFEYQDTPEICDMLLNSLPKIDPSTWLILLPQIIARISSSNKKVRETVHSLVMHICTSYPNPVLSSLIVPLKTESDEKHQIALELVDKIKEVFPLLVEDAFQIFNEILKIAQTQWETWHNALDEASKALIHRKDKEPTYQLLDTLHKQLNKNPESLYEVCFASQYGSLLSVAEENLKKSIFTSNDLTSSSTSTSTTFSSSSSSLVDNKGDDNSTGFDGCNNVYFNEAWTIYVEVFKELHSFIQTLNKVSLVDVSPSLASLPQRRTSMHVPGTTTTIHHFDDTLTIIKSKQRPRKIAIYGEDGVKKAFLLKPNEDTRLDQRAMQLFTIISRFLSKRLQIETYQVLPISSKVGLIGWLEDTETMFELIRTERKKLSISMLAEMNCLNEKEKELIMKDVVSINEDKAVRKKQLSMRIYALKRMISQTRCDEIRNFLMETSINANNWVERRMTYTCSLAVTSIAGYLIGVGDRHLQNIMMKSKTAKIVHIDFGDCFEVLKKRNRWPEVVPFRLTRVLLNGLEVTQVDGTFRKRCEEVMAVMRENGEVISELLETFIYDPLINCEKIFGDPKEIIGRIKDKLNGNDFSTEKPLNVEQQIDCLIKDATDIKNLAVMFSGWNPWF